MNDLPDYAKRLLVMNGYSFQTSVTSKELTSNFRDAYTGMTAGVTDPFNKQIAIAATPPDFPNSPKGVNEAPDVAHEVGHALSVVLDSIMQKHTKTPGIIISARPAFARPYLRDLEARDPVSTGSKDVDGALPTGKGGPPLRPLWQAREEAFARAYEIALGGKFATNPDYPRPSEIVRGVFPKLIKEVTSLHRNLERISARHPDNDAFEAAVRKYLIKINHAATCSTKARDRDLRGKPVRDCGPVQ